MTEKNRSIANNVRCTVVVPCFSPDAGFLGRLQTLKKNTDAVCDWLVVDDGNTPEFSHLWPKVESLGVRVISLSKNGGLPAARNAGISAVKTEFFLPLDHDDYFDVRLVFEGIECMDRSPRVGYVYSWAKLTGVERGIIKCPPWSPVGLLVKNLSCSCALVRTSAANEVGGYSEDLREGFEDWDFWLKLAGAGYEGFLLPKKYFSYYRRRDSMLSSLREASRESALRREIIKRHRDLYERFMEEVIAELGDTASKMKVSFPRRCVQIIRSYF